jgi:FkbM family methyltransferase
MGHVREKYTREYFLKKDAQGNPTVTGVVGIEEFEKGGINAIDKDILQRIDFSGKNVLEFGFGRGEAIKFAIENGASSVVGVDFAKPSYEIAREMLKSYGLEAELHCEDALDFMKKYKTDKKFDVVIMLDFIEHVPRKKFAKTLELLKVFLSEKTVIAVNTPFFKVDNDVIAEGLKKEALDQSDEYEETSGMHCNRYTEDSLIEFMRQQAFFPLSGHYFLKGKGISNSERKLLPSKRWDKAKQLSFPLKGSWKKESYQYAISEAEMKEEAERNKARYCSDYDHSNLVKADFGAFEMFSTKRLSEFYVPGKFEKFTSDILENSLEEGGVFVDVGAHYGYYSLLASTRVKEKGEVYAFEPVAENCEMIRRNVIHNNIKNIKIENCAISNESKEKDFHVTEASDSAGFHEHPLTKTREIRKVMAVSLDDYFKDKKIDVMKIDTEGHEMQVLRGMKKIIENNPEIKLLVEFNPKCLVNAGHDPQKLLGELANFGFEIFFIRDKERKIFRVGDDLNDWRQIVGENEYVNLLCIKKEYSLFASFFSHSAEMAGAEMALLDTVDGLIERGAMIHLILPHTGILEKKLSERPVSYDIISYPWWIETDSKETRDINSEIAESSRKIFGLLRKINPHVVFSNTSVINTGAIVAKMLGKPHIWRISEFGTREHGVSYLFGFEERAKFISDNSETIIFISEKLKDYYGSKIGENKSKVIYDTAKTNNYQKGNGIKYFSKAGSLKLLLPGSIQIGKQQKIAILAVNELVKRGASVELLLVGSIRMKKYHKELVDLIKEKKLEKAVRFTGYIENPLEVMGEADVVISCSLMEGLGKVLVEAILMGKPVIGARSGATVELVREGYNGFTFTPGDYQELTEKIDYFLKNPHKINEFGYNSVEFGKEKFDWNKMNNEFFSVLMNAKNKYSFNKKQTANDAFMELIRGQQEEIECADQKISSLDQEIHQKNQIVQQKDAEIKLMESSVFWKIRDVYLKAKSIFRKQSKKQILSKNILFISHDASRSGAPFVLLYFLRWLKENTDVRFTVFLQRGGELESEFRAVAPVHFLNMNKGNSDYSKLVYWAIKYSGLRKLVNKRKIAGLLGREKFDLIFANSIASSESIIELKKIADIPVINYVHELENAISDCCGMETFSRTKGLVDFYIGSSLPVADNLRKNHGISGKKVGLVYDYIPAGEFLESKDSFDVEKLRDDLDIPQDAFVVGASGTIEWRKGIDLFPQIASIALQKSSVPVYFLWIGGDRKSAEFGKVMQDLRKVKLRSKVFFVDYKIDYFSMIDAFILPSREDPFPLVCLQAAVFEKPVICFEKAGGMPEFVGEECGFVVPYLDVEKAAEKIAYLAENRDAASELGRNASEKVLDRHDVEKVSRELLKIINKISS